MNAPREGIQIPSGPDQSQIGPLAEKPVSEMPSPGSEYMPSAAQAPIPPWQNTVQAAPPQQPGMLQKMKEKGLADFLIAAGLHAMGNPSYKGNTLGTLGQAGSAGLGYVNAKEQQEQGNKFKQAHLDNEAQKLMQQAQHASAQLAQGRFQALPSTQVGPDGQARPGIYKFDTKHGTGEFDEGTQLTSRSGRPGTTDTIARSIMEERVRNGNPITYEEAIRKAKSAADPEALIQKEKEALKLYNTWKNNGDPEAKQGIGRARQEYGLPPEGAFGKPKASAKSAFADPDGLAPMAKKAIADGKDPAAVIKMLNDKLKPKNPITLDDLK